MSPGPPRFLITVVFILAVAGAGFGLLYFQQRSEQPKQNGTASNLISDDEKIAATERQIFASVPQKQAAYEKAFTELNGAGMVHSSSLPTLKSIHRREEMVKHFDDANTALEEVFKTAEETLRAELLSQGFSEYTSAKAAARFAQRVNLDLILKVRAYDRDSNKAFLQLLDLLDTRWGTWKPGAEDRLLFNNASDAKAYNALRQRIVELSVTEQTIQGEVKQRNQAADNTTPQP